MEASYSLPFLFSSNWMWTKNTVHTIHNYTYAVLCCSIVFFVLPMSSWLHLLCYYFRYMIYSSIISVLQMTTFIRWPSKFPTMVKKCRGYNSQIHPGWITRITRITRRVPCRVGLTRVRWLEVTGWSNISCN